MKTSRRFLDRRLMLGPSQDNAIQTERLATHFYTGEPISPASLTTSRPSSTLSALGEELVITPDGLPTNSQLEIERPPNG